MNNWISVTTFTYPHQAHMAKNLLESEGIDNNLRDELTAQVDNFAGQAIGGIKLTVQEADYQQAYDVLKKGGYIVEEGEHKKRNIKIFHIQSKSELNNCPYCGSDNISLYKEPNLITILLALFFRLLYPMYKKYYHCYDCDKNWRFTLKK